MHIFSLDIFSSGTIFVCFYVQVMWHILERAITQINRDHCLSLKAREYVTRKGSQ